MYMKMYLERIVSWMYMSFTFVSCLSFSSCYLFIRHFVVVLLVKLNHFIHIITLCKYSMYLETWTTLIATTYWAYFFTQFHDTVFLSIIINFNIIHKLCLLLHSFQNKMLTKIKKKNNNINILNTILIHSKIWININQHFRFNSEKKKTNHFSITNIFFISTLYHNQ